MRVPKASHQEERSRRVLEIVRCILQCFYARKAQLGGNYSKAYSLAKKSYAAEASPDAAQVMGVAACKMGDEGKAKSAYGKLSGGKKSALKSICAKSGIEL